MGELLAALLAFLGDLLQSVFGRVRSKNLRTYTDSERAVVIAAGSRTRERILAAGNRAYAGQRRPAATAFFVPIRQRRRIRSGFGRFATRAIRRRFSSCSKKVSILEQF